MKHTRRPRGVSLIEMLVAAAISAGVMASAVGLYVGGTRGFYNEQARTYMQSRTRTALDRMSTDARAAASLMRTVTIGSTTYTASAGPSPAACMIISVPSQDSHGLMYYGSSSGTPNAMVMDTIVYFYNATDQTLRRSVRASANVSTNDANSPRSSYRANEQNAILAANVNGLTLTFRDRDGSVVSVSPGSSVATIDINAQVLTTGSASGVNPVTVTGVRLRNMRSASIPGLVQRNGAGLSNVSVQAIYTSSTGAYPAGTIVATSETDANGNFELYGLVEGTYSVKAIPTSYGPVTVSGVIVQRETPAPAITIVIA